MTFASRQAFLVFMKSSGYRQIDDNKVYRKDKEKTAIYAWDDLNKCVNQVVLPNDTLHILEKVVI